MSPPAADGYAAANGTTANGTTTNGTSNSNSNSTSSTSSTSTATGRPASSLKPGIYVPTVAFFTASDEIDTLATAAHATRLARAGVAGLVTHGSNGEAVHLTGPERALITRTTRAALDAAGHGALPLIAGCGAQSTRETAALCAEAAAAGASHALVLPPAYYGGLLSRDRVAAHFGAVADASPLPLLVYNFPAAAAGLDLDSDAVLGLAAHANVVGVKLTCGNVGKLARVVAATAGTGGQDEDAAAGPAFGVFAGSADFLVPALAVGGHGAIAGLANVAPRACVELMRLWREGRLAEARALQAVVARGDWVAIQGGFVSVKVALRRYYGYGGEPRRPCALPTGAELAAQEDGFAELMEVERKLGKGAES